MKFFLSQIVILIFVFTSGKASAQQWNWVSASGSSQYENAKGLTHDANHNTYVVGTFEGSIFSGSNIIYSHGGVDIFIAKYDNVGNLIWARSGGGVGNDGDYNMSVTFDELDNIHVACRTTGDVIFEQDTLIGDFDNMTLLKYQSNGNLVYARVYGGFSYDAASDMDIDIQGNIYVTGGFHSTLDFGSVILTGLNHGDIYLAKFDAQGNIIWARQAGGISYDNSGGVAADTFGNVYITGYFSGSAMFDAIPLNSSSGTAAFIAKYDSSGNIKWVKNLNGVGLYESGDRIDVDETGKIYALGKFTNSVVIGSNTYISHGMTDMYLTKLDQNGNFIWVKTFGGSGEDSGYDIKVVGQGNHFLTGSFSDTSYFDTNTLISNGDADIFVLLLDDNGNVQWSKQSGGAGDDIGWGIDADGTNECFVSGSFSNTVTFDTFSKSSIGNTDLFVGRIIVNSNGINSVSNNYAFNVFPNPVKSNGKITLHSNQYKLDGIFYIYDAIGKMVLSESLNSGLVDQIIKLPADMTPGIYFIHIFNKNGINSIIKIFVAE